MIGLHTFICIFSNAWWLKSKTLTWIPWTLLGINDPLGEGRHLLPAKVALDLFTCLNSLSNLPKFIALALPLTTCGPILALRISFQLEHFQNSKGWRKKWNEEMNEWWVGGMFSKGEFPCWMLTEHILVWISTNPSKCRGNLAGLVSYAPTSYTNYDHVSKPFHYYYYNYNYNNKVLL